VRFRHQAPVRLFTVSVRQRGAAEPAHSADGGPAPEGPSTAVARDRDEPIRVAQALPLRFAVDLADGLRSQGFEVHIVAEAVKPGETALRHGNFPSRAEAESASRQLARLGVANRVVQIR